MKSTVIKRAAAVAQHETSISLEEEFWQGLEEGARARHTTLSPLILAMRQRHKGNLSSAVRVFVAVTIARNCLQPPLTAPGAFSRIPAFDNDAAQAT